MADWNPQANELFLEALDRPPGPQRTAFLDQACDRDEQLKAQVVALLEASDRAGEFLSSPAQEFHPMVVDRAHGDGPGAVIGPYKLLEEIGEGGMGVVYMAEQSQPVRRVVAVKVLKPGMDSRQVIARFEAERQALAMMDHPNIAKVLDAGMTGDSSGSRQSSGTGALASSATGRPYFVMELVKGVPITRYCDEMRLTVKERLLLFLPVCQAIQHAHQKGIIHRDIKPSNILVALYDGIPVPIVIDFGVAKAIGPKLTEQTLSTEFGAVLGTFEYMSPEQAELNQLDVDTRSDVYSLGVLLYELLTGTTPLQRRRMKDSSVMELLRLIREEEPPRPSTRLSAAEELPSIAANRGMEPMKLTGMLRGDLDWIVMKALEKDRNRRYATANGLAADIQRYLHDEPVQACPPSVAYRFRKFARRNKVALVMASVVALAALLVVGSVGWMARDRMAREHQIARDRAARQALIKERVAAALDDARKRHQEGRWRGALDAAKRAEALAATGGIDELPDERTREVLGDMQMLANLEDVRLRSTMNEAGYDLKEEDGGITRAFREYGIDIDLLNRDAAAERIRARSIRYELTVLIDSWSHVRRRLAQQGSQPIGKDWRELLEIARAADPDPWRDRFRSAVLKNDGKALVALAESAQISSLPAETVDRLGDALIGVGAMKEAAAFLKKGQQLHPQDYWINVNLGRCLFQLRPQQLDDAIRYFSVAVALRPEAALSHSNLGSALAAQGKLAEAASAYRDAIRLKPDNQLTYNDLAGVLQRQGHLDDAIAEFRQAIILEKKMAVASPRLFQAQFNLAVLLNERAWQLSMGDNPMSRNSQRAIDLAQEAATLFPNVSASWKTLGAAHYRAGNWKAAVESLEKSRQLNPRYRTDSVILFLLSMAHVRLNEIEQAGAFYDQAAHWSMGVGSTDEEVRRLCAEAAALMRLEVPHTLKQLRVLTPGPTLLTPASGATLDNGTFDSRTLRVWEFGWSDVPGATQYHLYVIAPTAKIPAINNPVLTSPSYRFKEKGYVANQNRLGWSWKVRALVQNTWTDWSEERIFAVAPLDDNKPASPEK